MEIILKHKGEKILFEGKVNLYTLCLYFLINFH